MPDPSGTLHALRCGCVHHAAFIYNQYDFSFGFIEEMELLQEAGFHPLEVIRSATMEGEV
ncbi:MAG TPA: hypothetical protein VNQ14_08805 [Woeseiaceae bacterium]|nr:hypothetical protein [Woeseiaceae bacterium]